MTTAKRAAKAYKHNVGQKAPQPAEEFQKINAAGVKRHGAIAWFTANRAAARTICNYGMDVEENRETIALIVLRVLDSLKPDCGWEAAQDIKQD